MSTTNNDSIDILHTLVLVAQLARDGPMRALLKRAAREIKRLRDENESLKAQLEKCQASAND